MWSILEWDIYFNALIKSFSPSRSIFKLCIKSYNHTIYQSRLLKWSILLELSSTKHKVKLRSILNNLNGWLAARTRSFLSERRCEKTSVLQTSEQNMTHWSLIGDALVPLEPQSWFSPRWADPPDGAFSSIYRPPVKFPPLSRIGRRYRRDGRARALWWSRRYCTRSQRPLRAESAAAPVETLHSSCCSIDWELEAPFDTPSLAILSSPEPNTCTSSDAFRTGGARLDSQRAEANAGASRPPSSRGGADVF